jgi:hypothetical protein
MSQGYPGIANESPFLADGVRAFNSKVLHLFPHRHYNHGVLERIRQLKLSRSHD